MVGNGQLELNNVSKSFAGHVAVDGVSFSVRQGSIYGLLGPNGAGKTTLLRIINRILRADSGEVLLDGRPMSDGDVRRIGYMPEERGLYKKMTVADEILYFAQLRGLSRADARCQMDEWLQRFNLVQWAGSRVEQLSKGMAQKVQFIVTVVHRPQLLIFDEPFSGFDPLNADQLTGEILRLRNEGATILFSTHNMASVEALCDEITLMNRARVVLQGCVDDIRRKFRKKVLEVTTADGKSFNYAIQPGETMHDAIAALNDRYALTGFREVLPSMHEVFVESVTSSDNA